MTLARRKFLHLGAGTAALSVMPRVASALDYPTRPVRIIVGFAAGGPQDIFVRLTGQSLSKELRQPVVVENRPGAVSNLAAEEVAHAAPDGYMLLSISPTNCINESVYTDLNFDFVRDIAPVAGIARTADVMLVNPAVPAKTGQEFIAYAKANPGRLNMASAGTGSFPHVVGELFKMMAGVNLVHVPYRGDGPAIVALLGGEVQVAFASLAPSLAYIKDGKLRALGLTTPKRSEQLPNVPTIGEFVPGYEATAWYAIGAPVKTPTEIIATLNKGVNAALADPTFKARLAALGAEPFAISPSDFAKLVADETEKWRKVVQTAGIKAG